MSDVYYSNMMRNQSFSVMDEKFECSATKVNVALLLPSINDLVKIIRFKDNVGNIRRFLHPAYCV